MRRIALVGGLVVVLAAAIIVPAVAQTRGLPGVDLPELLANLDPTATSDNEGSSDGSSSNVSSSDANSSDGNSSSESNNVVGNNSEPDSVSSIGSDSSSSSTSIASSSDPDDPAGVSQEFSQRRITSGKASPSSSFSNSGDNVNACPTTQQVVNTGDVANQQGVSQYNTDTDDIDLSGSSITIDSSATATCDQTLDQAAAAGK